MGRNMFFVQKNFLELRISKYHMNPVRLIKCFGGFKKVIEIHKQGMVGDFLYHTEIYQISYELKVVVYIVPYRLKLHPVISKSILYSFGCFGEPTIYLIQIKPV